MSKNYQEIVKKTYSLLKQDKKVLFVSVVSSILTILLLIAFIIILYFSSDMRFVFSYAKMYGQEAAMAKTTPYVILSLFFAYLVGGFINAVANSIIIKWTYDSLSGKPLSIKKYLKEPFKHLKYLFIFSLIWGLVVFTIKFIRSQYAKSGFQAPAVIGFSFLGFTWGLSTNFVLPIMLIENKTLKESFTKSVIVSSKNWIKNLIGQFSIGFHLLPWVLVAFIPSIIGIGSVFIFPDLLSNLERTLNINIFLILLTSGFGLTIIILGLTALVLLTLKQIFFTILYYYAENK